MSYFAARQDNAFLTKSFEVKKPGPGQKMQSSQFIVLFFIHKHKVYIYENLLHLIIIKD